MVKGKISFQVEKSIERVFELISDISGYKKWSPGNSKFFIENKVTSEGPICLGTTYMDRLQWFGKAIGEIVEFEPPFEIAFQQKVFFGLPAFSAKLKYSLKAMGGSTEVNHIFEAAPHGLFKLWKPILAYQIHQERDRTCQAIKDALEQKS